MRKLLFAMALMGAVPTMAQKTTLKGADKFGKTITAADLKKHLYIVAGPEMEGRETAKEGQRKAAAYIEDYFKSQGLKPGNGTSYQQAFPVYEDKFEAAELMVNGTALKLDQDFTLNLGQSHTATQYFSEFVYVKDTTMVGGGNDYKNLEVTGKLVLVNGLSAAANSRNANYARVINALIRKGAAAVLLVQGGFPREQGIAAQHGAMSLNQYKRSVTPNVFSISEQVAAKLMGADWNQAKANTIPSKIYPAEVKLAFSKSFTQLESTNVLGVVEGTDKKDEYLFVTAHYDHIGIENGVINAGADDDGSGTVSILEMAEAFAKAKAAGKGPRRSIVFMTVSGEEKGLWGSAYYSNHPIFPLENTVADLNIDMIGRVGFEYQKSADSGNYVYVIGDDKLSSDLRPVSEAANKQFVKMKLDYKYNDPNDPNRFYYRSDHYNFAVKGVPVIFYFNGVHADYHRPGDTPDKINYPLMEKRARLVFYTAWEMANRENKIVRDKPL